MSRLSDRDIAIIRTVQRFRQVSAAQVRRLHFPEGTDASRGVKQRRSLARLTKWGEISRLDRPMGGSMGGSAGYVYVPTWSRARVADPHTLDITELFVRLKEAERVGLLTVLVFDPEPFCHVQVGHIELKPDAFVRLQMTDGIFRYFIEVDRSTEWRAQLNKKMRQYNQAYEKWQERTFPLVLYIVPDDERRRFVETVVKRQYMPGLFEVCLLSQAIQQLESSH